MDLRNNQIHGNDQPQDILPSLQSTILDSEKHYVDKIDVLLASWEYVSTNVTCAPSEDVGMLLRSIYRHTLHVILKAEWRYVSLAIKTHLMDTVTKCHRQLDSMTGYQSCTVLSSILIQIMDDPWDVETLSSIISDEQTKQEQVEKYFLSENGALIVMRIVTLVDAKCEDFALRLAEKCQQFLLRQKARESADNFLIKETEKIKFSSYQLDLITDIYLSLLACCGKILVLSSLFQDYDLKEGVELLQRNRDRKFGMGFNDKLWINYKKIPGIASIVFLSAAFVQPIEDIESCNLLEALITEWISFQESGQLAAGHGSSSIENVARKLVHIALSSKHIYILCQVLSKHFHLEFKPFCVELFVIALTVNMNEIEALKNNNYKDEVKDAEIKLANRFLSLSDLFQDDLKICRECILTAFSLNPTEQNLDRLKVMAAACGYFNPDEDRSCPSLSDVSMEAIMKGVMCVNGSLAKNTADIGLETGQKLESQNNRNLKGSTFSICIKSWLSEPIQELNTKAVSLSSELCEDLAIVIASPRCKMLEWVDDWPKMLSMCELYRSPSDEMKNHTCIQSQGSNLDCNASKYWPVDVGSGMYGGIEKGYEQYIDPNEIYYVPTETVLKKPDFDYYNSTPVSNKTEKQGGSSKKLTDLDNASEKKENHK